jgi:hypothetical protein
MSQEHVSNRPVSHLFSVSENPDLRLLLLGRILFTSRLTEVLSGCPR